MSDPVTNVEIEDVLTSIRRLVSEGEWMRTGAAAPKAQGPVEAVMPAVSERQTARPVAERFVLTPSLRVTPDEDAVEEQDAQQDDSLYAESLPADDQTPVAYDVHAAFTPEADVAAESEPPAFLDAEDSATFRHQPEATFQPEQQVEAEEDRAVFFHSDSSGRESLEKKIAELEAAVSGQPDEWEPDGSETSMRAPWPVPPRGDHRISKDMEEAETAEPSAFDNPPRAYSDFDAATVQFGADADPIPQEHLDDLTEDLAASPASATTDHNDDEVNAYLDEAGVVDEEMLRKLVAEVVHQELSGVLGERITRNVRKLVRREIYRVLASQEFE